MKHLFALLLALGPVTLVACSSHEDNQTRHQVEEAAETVSIAVSGMT